MKHMATAAGSLTLEQYHKQYGSEPGWEFWFGEAVRKPVPTWYHCVLQILLGKLLFRARYVAGSELDLRIDPNWEPRPDVTAALSITGRYPTKSSDIELVIEILSDDQMRTLLDKCQQYARIGIAHIYVFDPEGRRIWKWNASINDLDHCVDVDLPNGTVLRYDDIWSEFERRLAPAK